mgnify:CR=1 FL=1
MKKGIGYIITVVVSLTVGVCSTMVIYHNFPPDNRDIETVVKDVTITETNSMKSSIDEVYDAVVIIETYHNTQAVGTGTGFVYKIDGNLGYVITNYHVIKDANKIQVTNTVGQTVEATLLGGDEYADIAVLSIEKDAALKVVKIGDSTAMELGDSVFTVGSPLGKKYIGTVTKGILSGKDRLVTVSSSTSGKYMMQVLQTDAAINPGNSGGPLVNMQGEVIGINSLKLVEDEIEGMGFAIPIEIAMSAIDKLEKGEKVLRPVLGVSLIDATNTYTLYYNKISIDDEINRGAVIASVEDGYPAKEAGLQKGDVILEVNDVEVEDSAHLRFLLYKYNVGDTIKIKVYRSGKIKDVDVKLDKSAE